MRLLLQHRGVQLLFLGGSARNRKTSLVWLFNVEQIRHHEKRRVLTMPMSSGQFDDTLPVIPPPLHLRQLIAHVDAAHTNKLRQHCSAMGYGCCLAGGVVACRSCTQSVCAQSSMEAKLVAANAAAKVTKCLCLILHELGHTQTEPTPGAGICEDDDYAINIVNHNSPTNPSRHVKIRCFALQHWRIMNDIILIHLPGGVNPMDVLTKASGWVIHHRHAPYLMGHHDNACRQTVCLGSASSLSSFSATTGGRT